MVSPRTFSGSMGWLTEPVESGVTGLGKVVLRKRGWRHLHDRRWRWLCLHLLQLGKLRVASFIFAGLLFALLIRLCRRLKGRLELSKRRVVRR